MFKKVMIIDDTEVDRYIAERAIKKAKFADEIIQMEGVQDALDYLKRNSENADELPEIIFLDIRMPGYDGFDFLDMFKDLPEGARKKIIIVMLTSSLNDEDHTRAMNNKFVRQFINKPLSAQELGNIEAITEQGI